MLENRKVGGEHGGGADYEDYLDYYSKSSEEERVALSELIRDKIARKQELTAFEELFLERNTDFFHADDQPSYRRRPN